ncbi:GNAT family N-acetyltransferase [Clostridiaceae bacterium UIB06]|uniref:GNAT family N-acetyltransferase n=1 Tax=Clostridium thailandense TaxID=2794346 RepID=A0A949TXY8_9CLOT|nr:GNAT family protein [Clostridium thailandense]MBV7272938.1 GNAT family N-acetyltransferase [Clostridium thailandense]MCH5136251.1 GNAT family N-acetyltransferase [Clostridiaceae bacterium UIB06]
MLKSNLLKGNNLRLTSLKENDLNIFEDWYNDINFLRNYDMVAAFPKSQSELLSMLTAIRTSNDRYIFAVRTIAENKFIGVTGFENILWNNGVATIYIGIGDDSFKGKGLGKESLSLTMDFGFEELNLHRIQLNVLSYNTPAIKLYESLGFKREGIYREFVHRDGKRHDMYLYGILRSEWKSYLK